MELKKIEEALKKNNLKLDFTNKGIFNFVATKLEDTIEIEYITQGFTGSHITAIIISDRNLIISKANGMFSGIDFNIIPIESISSIELEAGLLFSKIFLSVGSIIHTIEKVASPHASELQKVLLNLKNKKPIENTENKKNQDDPFEKLRKYKSLLDDGIISQEEFDLKKKELL